MAFDKTYLEPLGGQNTKGVRVWVYSTADTLANIVASGYFDNGATTNTGMRHLMKANDIVMAVTSTGGTASMDLIKIDAVTAGVITVSSADINDA